MSLPLSGKAALVTGASGGIGAAVARLYAANGCRLALHYCSGRTAAERLKNELVRDGTEALTLRADLTKPREAAGLVRRCLGAFGRLDVLINNAGAVLGARDFLELTERDWERTLRLNLVAPYLLSREAFKAMQGKGGIIINVSSIAAKYGGSPRSMHYGAAKAALESMTAGFARLGAPHGILVNAIRPGVIDTPFHGKFRKALGPRIRMIPLGRMGKPEEVARLALLLAAEGGNFITGQVLSVTGGE